MAFQPKISKKIVNISFYSIIIFSVLIVIGSLFNVVKFFLSNNFFSFFGYVAAMGFILYFVFWIPLNVVWLYRKN